MNFVNNVFLRSKLFYDARRKKKAGKLTAAWTQEGTIMIRTHESSKPLQIRTHSNLKDALYQVNPSGFNDSEASEDTDFDDNY